MPELIRIGSRKSKLAIAQAQIAIKELKRHYPKSKFILKTISTAADKLKGRPFLKTFLAGVFVKELEKALLEGKIDLAVHSAKDIPVNMAEGLEIACILKRENPFDALVARDKLKLKGLPVGAKIGTSSLRRIAQLKRLRPDLRFVEIRGNLETRLKKIGLRNLDGIVLAFAGLKRLGLQKEVSEVLNILPCAGQGAIAVEIRKDNPRAREMAHSINHNLSFQAVSAERAFLQDLGGGCNVPIACLAEAKKDRITLEGLVCSLDGNTVLRQKLTLKNTRPQDLGQRLAEMLLEKGADKLLWQG